jgi:hypothetical protein
LDMQGDATTRISVFHFLQDKITILSFVCELPIKILAAFISYQQFTIVLYLFTFNVYEYRPI